MADSESGIDRKLKSGGVAAIAAPDSTTRKPVDHDSRESFRSYRTTVAGEERVERFGWTFCPGDKVMQVENDYDREVYNGDLGIISRLDMEEFPCNLRSHRHA